MSAPGTDAAVNATKTDLDYTYLAAQNGQLPEAQAREFIQAIADQEGITKVANVIGMEAPVQHIPWAGFTGRISFPDRPGIAATEAERSRMAISEAVLRSKDLKATVFLDYKVQNENIMRWGLAGFVQMEMARQVGMDTEDSTLNGDTDSLDDSLALFDGLIKQVASPIDMTASPIPVTDYPLFLMRQSLPKQYLRDIPNLVYLCSPHFDGAYQMFCQSNPKSLGVMYKSPDMMGQMAFMGSPIVPLAGMPDDTLILTHRSNINIGFWLRMFLETQRDIDAGVDKFVLRYSMDATYTFPAGAVCFQGVEVGIYPSLA